MPSMAAPAWGLPVNQVLGREGNLEPLHVHPYKVPLCWGLTQKGSILPSLNAREPAAPAVMAMARAVQGWEAPQESGGEADAYSCLFLQLSQIHGKSIGAGIAEAVSSWSTELLLQKLWKLPASLQPLVLAHCVRQGLGPQTHGERATSWAPVCPSWSPWSLALRGVFLWEEGWTRTGDAIVLLVGKLRHSCQS